MVAQELGLMSQKEVSRFEVVGQVLDGGVSQAQAAQLLGCRSGRSSGCAGGFESKELRV